MSTIAVCACGWRSKRTTPALAEAAGRRHVCERFRQQQERASRVAARIAAPGVVRDCHHKVASHQHGTYEAYVLDRCTCRPCRAANAAYEGRRAKEKAYGRWKPYVDARPARRHVRALRAAGMGVKQIAKVSGVPTGSMSKLVYGDPRRGMKPSKRIRPETEKAILAVTADLEHLGATVSVDAGETHRLLQALVARGWSQSQLASRLGMERSNFGGVMRREQCYAATVRAVAALHAELKGVAPPERTHRERIAASRARNYATAHGWTLTSSELVEDPPVAAPERRTPSSATSSELVAPVDVDARARREAVLARMRCEHCGQDGRARDFACERDGRRFAAHDFALMPLAAAS